MRCLRPWRCLDWCSASWALAFSRACPIISADLSCWFSSGRASPKLPQLLNVATGQAALFQILLVILFRRIERDCWYDLGRNGLGIAMRLFQRLLRGQRFFLLLGGMEEDGGTILRAPVGTLAVHLGRVVILPKDLQQIGITDFRRIELDFDRFGVARAVGANFLIGRVLGVAADVADARWTNSRDLSESGFHAPKTPCCKRSFFHSKWPLNIILTTEDTGEHRATQFLWPKRYFYWMAKIWESYTPVKPSFKALSGIDWRFESR